MQVDGAEGGDAERGEGGVRVEEDVDLAEGCLRVGCGGLEDVQEGCGGGESGYCGAAGCAAEFDGGEEGGGGG